VRDPEHLLVSNVTTVPIYRFNPRILSTCFACRSAGGFASSGNARGRELEGGFGRLLKDPSEMMNYIEIRPLELTFQGTSTHFYSSIAIYYLSNAR
jgi:hypothetical protein